MIRVFATVPTMAPDAAERRDGYAQLQHRGRTSHRSPSDHGLYPCPRLVPCPLSRLRGSTSLRPRGTPASRRSRWASCTGWRRPSPRSGCSGPSPALGEDRDYILELLLSQATAGLPYEECVGVSYQQLHEDPDTAIGDIVDRYPPGRRPVRCGADRRQRLHRRRRAERAVDERPHRGQPRRARRARGEGQGPHPRAGRPGRRAVPGRDRRPARPHRRGGGQPLRPGQHGRDGRRARAVRARSATCCPRSRCWSRRRWPSCRQRSRARCSAAIRRCCHARRWTCWSRA